VVLANEWRHSSSTIEKFRNAKDKQYFAARKLVDWFEDYHGQIKAGIYADEKDLQSQTFRLEWDSQVGCGHQQNSPERYLLQLAPQLNYSGKEMRMLISF
jgi:hypothetical protein